MKFKVGDKVRVLSNNLFDTTSMGKEGKVVVADMNDFLYPAIRVKFYDGSYDIGYESDVELIIKGENKMSNIVSKVKQLALSKGDKLLRKHGVVDECGELTSDGMAILLDTLFDEYKDTIVEKIQKVDDAEKKGKK